LGGLKGASAPVEVAIEMGISGSSEREGFRVRVTSLGCTQKRLCESLITADILLAR